MWRRELPAILILSSLAVGGGMVAWALYEPPGQRSTAEPAVIVSFHAAIGRRSMTSRDPSIGATMRLADGSQEVVGIPLSIADNCRVGDRVSVRTIVSNAGRRRHELAADRCDRQ